MKQSESRIQQECVQWFRNNYCLKHHSPRGIIFSVPNERSDKFEQMRMISTGLLSGVSDLIVVLPSGKIVFTECKDDKGRQSPSQKDFQDQIEKLGHTYILVRSLADFQERVKTLMDVIL